MTAHIQTVSAFRQQIAQQRAAQWFDATTFIIWFLALVPATFLILGAAFQPWIDPADLFRDPLAVAELKGAACCKVYDGAISSLGIIGWMTPAAISLFAAGVLLSSAQKPQGSVLFFIYAGLFTAFLGSDDLFLVHENVLPAFGVPELATYGAYALIGIGYLATSWRLILTHRFVLFGGAIALLATSVLIDRLLHSDNVWRLIIEDGAKFVGISMWMAFHIDAAWNTLIRSKA